MAQIADAWLEHQRKRWSRPDAHRWRRCDAERYRRFDPRFYRGRLPADHSDREWRLTLHSAQRQLALLRYELALVYNEYFRCKAYNPDQPRWPAGSGDDSGRWRGEDGWER